MGWGVVGRFLFGPGIARPRPGKSDRWCGSWGYLPADLGEVGLECTAFGRWEVAGTNVACFVAAIAETLSFDPPACTHPVCVAVLGTIACALPGVIPRPIFSVSQKEVLDGVIVFDDAIVAVVAVA